MGKNKSIGLRGGPNEIIIDPKGQWNHPGKNTRIEGNHITMQDVQYPVWAQPNVGPGTMMMPGSEHYFKNADYVDEYPMAQDGTEIPDEAAVPEKSFLYDIEKLINKSLGDINKKAKNFSENPEENNNIDNMRHASGGRYAAEAIQQKVRDLPYVGGLLDFVGVDKTAGFIGANAMGIGHELRTIFGGDERPFLAKLQEMGEDTFNNYVGSIIGSLGIDDSKKDEVIKYLSYNNLLPDGYVRTEQGKKDGFSENIYFKDAEGKIKMPTFQDAGSTSTPTKQIDFMTNWANSPMHNQMLDTSSKSDKFKNKVKIARTNFDDVNISDEEVDGFLGQYINGKVTMNPKLLDEARIGNGYDSVLVHELSHFTDDGNPDNMGHFKASNIPLSDRKLIKKYGKEGIKRAKKEEEELNELLLSEGLTPNNKKVIKERIARLRYLNRDTETRSRINATRYFYEEDDNFGRNSESNIDKNLPSIFDSPVTPEMIEVMKKSGQYQQLQEIYTDDQILEMFNTISDSKTQERTFNVLNARYGKELPTAQKGKSILIGLLKKAKEWAPSLFGKTDDVLRKSDNIVKTVSNTSKKGLYEMLPIRQLEYPTHYGSVNIDDGTVQNALDILKAQGKYADDVGFEIKDLVGENIQYLGNQGGRTIVNVPLPNGKSQMFYKSTDLAGKGTEGLWQPYAGHARVLDFPTKAGPILNENWFIKDGGFKDFYNSQSFRDIAGNLDRIAAEQGWDMSEQILKSKLEYGGDLPKAQKGKAVLKELITRGAKYVDQIIPSIKNYFKGVDNFEFKNLPSIDQKQFMRVVDGEFDVIEYDHLIPTQQEISDIAKATRKRLLSDKFIKNNMEATGRSKDEITGYIDDYIKEFENSTLSFDKLQQGANGLYTRGKITIDPRSPHLTKENVLGSIEHEVEHMFSNVGQQGSDLYRHPKFKLIDRTGMPDEDLVKNMGQAFEQQVRFRKALNWLEKNAGLKAGDNVTDEQVAKLTDAISNWSKEAGKDFRGTGSNYDIQHLFSNLDAEQFLKEGQYLMPGAPRNANLKNSNVRKGIKDILNKTYVTAPIVGGAFTVKEMQENGQLPTQQTGGPAGYDPYFDIDDKSKQRRDRLNTALSTVVANSDNDSDLEALLLMTAAMENSFGGNSKAYGRDYTRGPMSIDDAAYNDLFDPRGENNRYTAQQKKMFDWLSSMGLDPTNMNNVLKAGDELAGMATARMQYARSPESLPSSQDPNAMYDYYMRFYNKTDADHKQRFMGNYNAFIKPKLKTGGEDDPYIRYKKYVNGGFVGSDEDKKNYDKINRINYADAKAVGMTPANYIMTEFSKRS